MFTPYYTKCFGPNRWLLLCISLSAAVFMLPSRRTFAQDCGQILQTGIYDTSTSITETERATSFINWFKQRQFSSYQEAKQYGLQAGIPVGDLLIGLGLTADENGYRQFMNAIEWYQQQNTSFKQKTENFVKTINQGVVTAWEHCVSQSGLHLWIVQKSDPKVFVIHGRYLDDGAAKPELKNIQFEPADAVAIESGPFFKKSFFSSRTVVRKIAFGGAEVAQAFRRTKSGILTVIINTSRGPGLQADLPDAFVKPLPYIVEFSAIPNPISPRKNSTLVWNVLGATNVYIDQGVGSYNSKGSNTVSPLVSTTYQLTAYNDAGTAATNVTLTVKPIMLTAAQITFRTEQDDKDDDTEVEVFLKKPDGNQVSYFRLGRGSHFDDGPPSEHTYGLELNRGQATKEEITHGIVTIKTKANCNDKWCFKPKLVLSFSDGSSRDTGWISEITCIESHDCRGTGDNNFSF